MNYFIIDALNLVYRSHIANFELKTGSGLYSGMFYGFVRTVFSLKKKYRGYKFEVVWDRKPIHKIAMQPDYKAGRSSLPETASIQIPDIQTFLKNAGVDQYFMEGQEADDVIATLVEKYKKENGNTLIYSNDKDMLQLVETGKVTVFKPKVANSPEKFYDESAVIERFGVPPDKLSCFRSFDGDSSDNIVGINRVPRKIIANLVNEYHTIDRIYDAIDKENLTKFQRKSFFNSRDRVIINLKIINLNRNLDNIVHESSSFQKQIIVNLFKKYEIKSINPDNIVDIFSSSLNVRYTDPRDAIKVESYSLFD